MKRQIVAEIWDSYARRVLPANAPTVQRWECRRAFYAGCEALMRVAESALSAGEGATGTDLDVMVGVEKRACQFCSRCKARESINARDAVYGTGRASLSLHNRG